MLINSNLQPLTDLGEISEKGATAIR
jgi:hypothetical protein